MEFKIFSTMHPDYNFLVVKRGDDILIDTSVLKKTLTDKEKNYFDNHELLDNLIFSLCSKYLKKHPYHQWLLMYLPYSRRVSKDFQVFDLPFWENNLSGENYKSIQKASKVKLSQKSYSKITKWSEMPLNFVSLDVETTGLNHSLDSITQLSAVKYQNGVEIDRFDTFLKPSNNGIISQFITDLTGITQEDVDDAPRFSEVWDAFKGFIGDDILIGHNLQFDLEMLESECNRAKLDFGNYKYVDTLTSTKKKFPYLGRGEYKLELLKKRFLPEEISDLGSHNSLNDCLIAGELYKFLLQGD